MSRLLSLLLLFKSGYDVGRYISFEEKILVSKDDYFAAIRKSSAGWSKNENSYFLFMKHFLSTLLLCYKELDNYKGNSRGGVNSRQVTKTQQIRDFVLSHLIPVSKQEICTALPDASTTTVESVLGKMTKEGLIEKIGGGCATKYIKKSPD
jgi:Fic family protein